MAKCQTTQIVVDIAKLRTLGGGSLLGFCNKYNCYRQQLYALNGKTHVKEGTKSHAVYQKLDALGAVKIIEKELQ